MEKQKKRKRKVGRPRREKDGEDLRQSLIDAAADLIRVEEAEKVTVRAICERAGVSVGTYYHYFKNKDELCSYFVSEHIYGGIDLRCPLSDLPGRIAELWMHLIDLYQKLGLDFMASFYNSSNRAISAYADKMQDGFPAGTLLARCQAELEQAREEGYLSPDADPHTVSADICLIVKGCVLDWVICRGEMPLRESFHRILDRYLGSILCHQG